MKIPKVIDTNKMKDTIQDASWHTNNDLKEDAYDAIDLRHAAKQSARAGIKKIL